MIQPQYRDMVNMINDPVGCVEVAFAISILAWYNKRLLADGLTDNYSIASVIQELLRKAIKNS